MGSCSYYLGAVEAAEKQCSDEKPCFRKQVDMGVTFVSSNDPPRAVGKKIVTDQGSDR